MNQLEKEFIKEHLLRFYAYTENDNLQRLVEDKITVLRKMGINQEDFGSRKGCIDLHIHSNLSDGHFAPEDIFLAARYLGLTVISITDHATVAAYLQNPWLLRSDDCIVLPGIEVHTLYKDRPYHILLFGEALLTPEFSKMISKWQQKWNLRFQDICNILVEQTGLCINFNDILKEAKQETLDIAHIASAISKLTEESFPEVMNKYFGNKTVQKDKAYIYASNQKYLPSLFEVADIARQLGLHCVLAHPNKQQIDELEITSVKQLGLTGIEIYHPTISRELRAYLITVAKKHRIKMFGGSDFHYPDKHVIQFGFRKENDPNTRVPFAIFANSILNEPHIIIEGPLTIGKLSLEEKVSLILRPSFELMAFDTLSKSIMRQYSCTNCRIEKSLINSSKKMVDYVQSCINANTHPIIINVNQEGGRLNTIDWFENIFLSNTSVAKLSRNKRKKHYSLLAKELKLIGISWNLAPVCDIRGKNISKIGSRSFGRNLDHVCRCIYDFIQAARQNNIATTLKHFPGTGSCDEDCHWDFPYLSKIESSHLAPFVFGMTHDADAIMISNAIINGIDKKPALLSSKVTDDLLIHGLGAEQIIITDNLSMQALIDEYEDLSEIATSAFIAGSDFIMLNPDFSRGKNTSEERVLAITEESRKRNAAYEKLLQNVQNGLIDEVRLDRSVRKIISFYNKYAVSSVNKKWEKELASLQSQKEVFIKECAEQLVCVVRDNNKLLPLSKSNPCVIVFRPSMGAKADSSWHRDVYIPESLKENVFYINETTKNIYDIVPDDQYDVIVYISYNISIYPAQESQILSLKDPYVIIGTGDDDEAAEKLKISCYISAKERTTIFTQKAFSILLGK